MSFFESSHLNSFFLPGSRHEVRELTLAMMIREFAGSAIMLFEPIYLFTQGFTIVQILLFYAAVYALYLPLIPFGGKFIRAHGYEHGIVYSTPFLVLYYLSLSAIPLSSWALLPAVLCIGLSKTLFWAGFHADFARYGSMKGKQGKELSTFVIVAATASVLGPLVGGTVLAAFGFTTLFIAVAALLVVSNIPLLLTPEVFKPRELLYVDAWKRLIKPENARRFAGYLGYGEELYLQALWPLFMFIVVPGFAELGAIGSAASLAAVAFAVLIGRLADRAGRHRTLGIGAVMNLFSWLLRIPVATPFGALAAHAFGRVSREAVGIPLIALTYEYARGYSVTKTAVFLEMSVAVAKLSAALLGAVAFAFLPDPWVATFGFAALVSLLYLFGRSAFLKQP